MSSPRRKNKASLDRVADLFEKALELGAAARAAYLDHHLKADPVLRAELESLLAFHDKAQSQEKFLAGPALLKLIKKEETDLQVKTGELLGDFRIERILGKGSFATVYLAVQQSLNRKVALKVAPARSAEARTMAHLEHDHIVKVFSETIEPSPTGKGHLRLLCMQYVAGVSLESILGQFRTMAPASLSGETFLNIVDNSGDTDVSFNPNAMKFRAMLADMSFPRACLWLGGRLVDGLDYAHGRGILHLDVKPANILINTYGRPFLTDFNVSIDKRESGDQAVGNFGGTYQYMPPEQAAVFTTVDLAAAVSAIDRRADIYSLGKVLKELWELREKSAVDPLLDLQVSTVFDKATHPDPGQRFVSASQFAKALEGCLEIDQVVRRLPPMGMFFRWAESFPIAGLLILSLIPQLAGSFVNIVYNLTHIVSEMSSPQQAAFHRLLWIYNLIAYIPGAGFWLWQLYRIKRPLDAVSSSLLAGADELQIVRERLVRLPVWSICITTLGWLPGALFFPFGIECLEGSLPRSVYTHFSVSFVISWLIALSHSFLYIQYLTLRVLYPRLWVGCASIRKQARQELQALGTRLRVFYVLTPLVPLVGAALVVWLGPRELDPRHYESFRRLVILLLALGMGGIFLAFRAIRQLYRTLVALIDG